MPCTQANVWESKNCRQSCRKLKDLKEATHQENKATRCTTIGKVPYQCFALTAGWHSTVAFAQPRGLIWGATEKNLS